MAEDGEPKFHEDYLEVAKKLSEEGDLEKRVEGAADLARKYQTSSMIQSGLMKEFHTELDFGKLGDLQKAINDAHLDKGVELSENEVDEVLKDALMEILPKVHYGTDDRDTNLDVFRGYCSLLKEIAGQNGNKVMGETWYAIRNAIKSGNGIKAINAIIDTMVQFKSTRATQAFDKYLVPTDHIEFRDELGKYITKNANKYLKGAGELLRGNVAKNIDQAFELYTAGKYDDMLKYFGGEDFTKNKKVVKLDDYRKEKTQEQEMQRTGTDG